jgi:hypothetical protein
VQRSGVVVVLLSLPAAICAFRICPLSPTARPHVWPIVAADVGVRSHGPQFFSTTLFFEKARKLLSIR